MKKRVEHESKNTKTQKDTKEQKDLKDQVLIPSRDNFEQYFTDFYKMFQHCKYNLVALNKRFDTFEKFFKNYQDESPLGRVNLGNNNNNFSFGSNSNISNNLNNSSNHLKAQPVFKDEIHSEDYEIEQNKKTKKKQTSQKKKITKQEHIEVEENFPISMEDLEFLTKNYIPDNNNSESPMIGKKRSGSSRKTKSPYDVIVINKKKMIVDEEYDIDMDMNMNMDFSDKEFEKRESNSITKDKIMNDDKPDNFNQKLFDYKSFNHIHTNTTTGNNVLNSNLTCNTTNVNPTGCEIKKEEEKNNKLNTEDSKWISKVNDEKKNEDKESLLTADLTLSLADLNAISKIEEDFAKMEDDIIKPVTVVETNSTKKKTSFADFIKQKKEKLIQSPNLIKKPTPKKNKEEEINKELNSK